MRTLSKIAASAAIVLSALVPFSAYAITPMGGLVTALVPCNYGYLISVVNPGGIGSGLYMWTPATISFLWGPPILKSWVLGMTDAVLPCFVGHAVVGYGQRITFMGSSLPGVPTELNNPAVLSGHGLY
jgi:hypothetical protein